MPRQKLIQFLQSTSLGVLQNAEEIANQFILVSSFTTLKIRTLSMITDTAEQRYENLIKTNPEIFQRAPLKNSR